MGFKVKMNILPAILIITAFGPYITPSLRLEHFILYPLAIWSLVSLVTERRQNFNRLSTQTIILFSIIVIISLVNTFMAYPVPVSRIFSQLDNWLQPVLLAIISLRYYFKPKNVLPWILTMLSFNSIVQIYQTLTGDLTIVSSFLTKGDSVSTVADNSAQMGRYVGVFNQPFEGGVAFSIGLLSWFYLKRKGENSYLFWVSLPLLLIGGLLTVSKVFILLAIPIFLLGFLWENIHTGWKINTRTIRVFALFSVVTISSVYILSTFWTGAEYALRLLSPENRQNETLLQFYTSGRLGSSQTALNKDLAIVLTDEPIFGYGLKSFQTVDNGYFDAYVQSGILGIVCIMLVILIVFLSGLRYRYYLEGRCLVLISILISIANIGAPALTINRANIILWLTIFCLHRYAISQENETSGL